MAKFVPPEGPYPALSTELCRCGFYKASNLGRCAVCLDYYNDNQLANYFDWLVWNAMPKAAKEQARKALERHGSMIAG